MLLQVQKCPYCEHSVSDEDTVWGLGQEVTVCCSHCEQTYQVKLIFTFEGYEIEKVCQLCKKEYFNDFPTCDCSASDSNKLNQ